MGGGIQAWFAALDAEVWDRQIEENGAAGRLDFLAAAEVI